jgi:hypothetical protein
MGKRFDHGERRGRNLFVTYCSNELMDKLDVLRLIITRNKVKHMIVTGFEIVALNSRDRARLMSWIRQLRNEGINIILFTVTCPGRCGSLGALRYSARTVTEVGAYLKQKEQARAESAEASVPQNKQAIVATEEQQKSEVKAQNSDASSDKSEALDEHTDKPELTEIFIESLTQEEQHSDSDPLRTKELAFENV